MANILEGLGETRGVPLSRRHIHMEASTLVLVPTRRCNLRCRFCHLTRGVGNLSATIGRKAVDYFLRQTDRPVRIRFLGGEPMLALDVIKTVVSHALGVRAGEDGVTFDLTTNGTISDEATLRRLQGLAPLELVVTWYGGARSLAPFAAVGETCVNVVIQERYVDRVLAGCHTLLSMGFRRFNFLPAYYVEWSGRGLRGLRREFGRISRWLSDHPEVWVRNLRVASSVPLFNDAVTVDCNGDIFLNNMFLFRPFASLRGDLRVGRVGREVIFEPRTIDYPGLLRRRLDPAVYRSTVKVDRSLTDFVHELAAHGYQPDCRSHQGL